MNGKIILCLAAVLVGQTMSYSVFDGEELKKIGEQVTISAFSVASHLNQLVGIAPINSGDAQKYYDKLKGFVGKSITDFENEASKLKESVRKNLDPKTVEKIDEIEKEIKKQTAEAKQLFDEKVAKPINDKYKEDVKKISDAILKSTKEYEATVNKAIDGIKSKQ